MKVLITGICGFTGSVVARALQDLDSIIELFGIDNFIRPGSERNRAPLQSAGVRLHHGDVRHPSDLESLPGVDWVIDAAANPSVLSGVDGKWLNSVIGARTGSENMKSPVTLFRGLSIFRGWYSTLRERCGNGIGSRQFLWRKFLMKSPRTLNYIPIG